jgi:hypothetical protein
MHAVGGTTIGKKASPGDSERRHVRTRSILAVGGIALFALGFIVTINTLPKGAEMLGGSSDGPALWDSPPALLVIGFMASLTGLALATIGPAVMFMRARRAKG